MRFPAYFLGHGSPMNALVPSTSTAAWAALGKDMPRPDAILVISAHWNEPKLGVLAMPEPEQIYDMYGFPDELYRVKYPAKGSPELAHKVKSLLDDGEDQVELVTSGWGLDHGAWSTLKYLVPAADIPVVQLSVDSRRSDRWHFELGKKLAPLRDQRVLIVASGSIVHNLREMGPGPQKWALDFQEYIEAGVEKRDFDALINWQAAPHGARAVPTPEHYQPFLYLMGLLAAHPNGDVQSFLGNEWDRAGVGMLSYSLVENEKEL